MPIDVTQITIMDNEIRASSAAIALAVKHPMPVVLPRGQENSITLEEFAASLAGEIQTGTVLVALVRAVALPWLRGRGDASAMRRVRAVQQVLPRYQEPDEFGVRLRRDVGGRRPRRYAQRAVRAALALHAYWESPLQN